MRHSLLGALFALTLTGAPSVVLAQIAPETAAEFRTLVDAGLSSEDVAVKSWSLRAAALLGDRELVALVTAELENANASVRVAAATGLLEGGLSTNEALARLTQDLVEGDANVRTLILRRILPVLGDSISLAVIEPALGRASDDGLFDTLVRHIAYRGEGSIYRLLDSAAADSARRTVIVRHVVGSRRAEGVSLIERWAASRDLAEREAAADIAISLNTASARTAVEPLLADSDAALAQRVGLYLAGHGNLNALQNARDLGLNPAMPEDLRMEALALVRDNGAALVTLAQLDEVLAEPGLSPAMRVRVFETIGATRSPEAIDRLQQMFNGLFAEERTDALAGIGFTGQGTFVQPLAELLRSNSHQALRVGAARALGHLGGDEAAQPLAAQLNFEPDPVVKFAIMEGLSYSGSSLAAQPIANEFVRQDRDTTLAGLAALRRIGGTGVAAQVEAISNSFRDPSVRWQAVLTLVHLDPDLGRIRLLQALDRPPEGFREQLNDLPESLQNEVDDALLRHTDSSIRDAALQRVLNRPDGGYAVLRPMLDGTISPDVRRQAISVVTARRSADDVELLQRLAGDIDRGVRLQAYGAIVQMARAENEELISGFASSPDLAVRAIGTYGILKLNAPEPPAPRGSSSRRRR